MQEVSLNLTWAASPAQSSILRWMSAMPWWTCGRLSDVETNESADGSQNGSCGLSEAQVEAHARQAGPQWSAMVHMPSDSALIRVRVPKESMADTQSLTGHPQLARDSRDVHSKCTSLSRGKKTNKTSDSTCPEHEFLHAKGQQRTFLLTKVYADQIEWMCAHIKQRDCVPGPLAWAPCCVKRVDDEKWQVTDVTGKSSAGVSVYTRTMIVALELPRPSWR